MRVSRTQASPPQRSGFFEIQLAIVVMGRPPHPARSPYPLPRGSQGGLGEWLLLASMKIAHVRRAVPAGGASCLQFGVSLMPVVQQLNDPWKRWWDLLGGEGGWRDDPARCSAVHARLLRFSAAHWNEPAWVDAVVSALARGK